MLYLLLLLLGLGLIFGLAFTLAEHWEVVRRQLLMKVMILLIVISSGLWWLHYWMVSSIACIPDCVGASLVGRDLSDFILEGANFAEANLRDAVLTGADLRGADFSGADLIYANLENVNLQQAKLLGTNLTGANLTGANLTGADFSGANLSNADLTGINLSQTILRGVRLNDSQLVGTDLTGVQLVAVDFTGAKMNGVKLLNADLSGAILSRADLSGARLNGARLSGVWLNLALLIGTDLANTNLDGASLIGADLASADLSESQLVGANLVGANMAGVNFNGANLNGAKVAVDELTANDEIDMAIKELNELQRSQILVDTALDGVTSNGQTVWPNPDVAELMTSDLVADTVISENVEGIKVGILHSLTGELAISEMAIRDGTLLAIQEINAVGGVLGKPVEPIVEDGASDPALFAEKARKLLEDDQVVAIFGGWSSESRKAMLPVLEEFNGILFYPAQYEGFESSPNVFYLGADPSQQVIPAVDYLVSEGYTNTLLIGSADLFPRIANEIIKAQMAMKGYEIAGEVYVPLDETDFSQIISQLQAAPPKAVINTLIGDSNVAFFQQLAEAGLTAQTMPVLSINVTEQEIKEIGPEVMVDHLVSGNYFQTLQKPENFSFVTAYKTAYGEEQVTYEAVEAGYTAVYLWKQLVQQAQSTALAEVREVAATDSIEFAAPEGLVHIDGTTQHLDKTARIGRIRDTGLIDEIWASPEPIPPDPFLTQYPWSADVLKLVEESQTEQTEQ